MKSDVVLETNLDLPLLKRGKVRDIYALNSNLLIVSTDRISAFDVVLPNGIPHKGEALNRLSAFWLNETHNIIQNHMVEVVDPMMTLVKKTTPIKIEFIIRGYLYGSAWVNYEKEGKICGVHLPKGLTQAGKLEEPILTPTTKADVGHDTELSRGDVVARIGEEETSKIEEACIKIFERASLKAERKKLIVADTKLEFGFLDGEVILIDEALTPDSTRYWSSEEYEAGRPQNSFDKQIVRDYLNSTRWNKQPPAPTLPDHIIRKTSEKYIEVYERLTGRKF